MNGGEPLVMTWSAAGRYGRMREVVAWLDEQVVPAARRSSGCLGAEVLVEDAVASLRRHS